jgi:hypothetical protein
MTTLKLIAFDQDDLNVVSAHVQDAVVRVGDMAFLPREKRFAGVFNRFDWSRLVCGQPSPDGTDPEIVRIRTALRFERVLAARTTGIDLHRPADVLVLLAVSFEPAGPEDPSGTVTLTFAGKAALKLDVECLEAELKDLGAAWAARARPDHPVDDDPDATQTG